MPKVLWLPNYIQFDVSNKDKVPIHTLLISGLNCTFSVNEREIRKQKSYCVWFGSDATLDSLIKKKMSLVSFDQLNVWFVKCISIRTVVSTQLSLLKTERWVENLFRIWSLKEFRRTLFVSLFNNLYSHWLLTCYWTVTWGTWRIFFSGLSLSFDWDFNYSLFISWLALVFNPPSFSSPPSIFRSSAPLPEAKKTSGISSAPHRWSDLWIP